MLTWREQENAVVTAAIGVVDFNGFSYLRFLCEGCDVKNMTGWWNGKAWLCHVSLWCGNEEEGEC